MEICLPCKRAHCTTAAIFRSHLSWFSGVTAIRPSVKARTLCCRGGSTAVGSLARSAPHCADGVGTTATLHSRLLRGLLVGTRATFVRVNSHKCGPCKQPHPGGTSKLVRQIYSASRDELNTFYGR